MKNLIASIFFLSVFVSQGTSQTITDALRLSQTYVEGTARTLAVGGSLNALGADFGTISSNPAGLASYRKSEFVISPGMHTNFSNAQLQGGTNPTIEATRNQLTIQNAGVVITSSPANSDWKTFNFGFGINRIASFSERLEFAGRSKGSITDRFLELADGLGPDQLDNFEAGLAYETGAIYDTNGDGAYDSDFLLFNPDHEVFKEQYLDARGGITELVLSLAGNYDERLFIGGTISVPFINYTEEKLYSEMDNTQDEIPFFNALQFEENLSITGAGFQGKMGLIFRASQALRLGFAIHSPSWYKLTEQYSSFMEYDFTDNEGRNRFTSTSPDGIFEYRVTTPWRWNASAGVLVGTMGFLHFDAEWQDYRNASYNFSSRDAGDLAYERDLNRSIDENFQSAFNFRGGAEVALNPFRIRGGFGLIGSPYAGDNSFAREYSGGIGIREKSFFLDLGYRLRTRSEGYIPYFTAESDFTGDGMSNAPQQFVTNDAARHQFIMTLGFKF